VTDVRKPLSFEYMMLDQLSGNLTLIIDRARDARKWFDKPHRGSYVVNGCDELDMVAAELFYLRQYLDRADDAVTKLRPR
jgi:hypothetical protein